jgi:hypothetical protein
MNFIGVITMLLAVMASIYETACRVNSGLVYSDSVIVQSQVLRVFRKNHTGF